MTITTATTMTIDPAALYRLTAWLSPAYPVGAFGYSHGVEYAVEVGEVRDRETLADWIGFVIERGAGLTDATLLAHAHRHAGDPEELDRVAELAAALKGSAELALESHQQGDAFLRITRRAWPDRRLDDFVERQRGRAVAYPIAFGLAAADWIDAETAAFLYLQAFAANLVSAGVRLVPLGQTDGQLATAALLPIVRRCAARATATPLEDLGGAALGVDWCSIRHETQYTRLFRS